MTPNRPPIYTKYTDLLGWLLDRTAKFPKHMRFGLVQKIETVALRLLEHFVEAIYRRDREALQRGESGPGEIEGVSAAQPSARPVERRPTAFFGERKRMAGVKQAVRRNRSEGERIWPSMFGWFQFVREQPGGEGLIMAECRHHRF